MNEPYNFFRTSLGLRLVCGILGGRGCDGGFVMEAVEVTAGFLEIPNPFLWLDASGRLIEA